MEKIPIRNAAFICCVIIALFWQLIYKQFYNISSTERRIENTEKRANERNKKIRERNDFFEAQDVFLAKEKKKATDAARQAKLKKLKISDVRITTLKKEAITVIENKLDKIVMKCQRRLFFLQERAKDASLSYIYEIDGFDIKAKHIDRHYDRLDNASARDEIVITVKNKEMPTKKGKAREYLLYKDIYKKKEFQDRVYDKHLRKENIASWTFYIENNKLTPLPTKDNIGWLFKYPYNYHLKLEHKYECNDLPIL